MRRDARSPQFTDFLLAKNMKQMLCTCLENGVWPEVAILSAKTKNQNEFNSLHLAGKYASIFTQEHYLFPIGDQFCGSVA